ncbi:MAG: DDE-type integrase/transposase/recombinase [Candidatus Nanopelagicales bacterium]
MSTTFVGVHKPATVRTTVPAGAEHPRGARPAQARLLGRGAGCRWVGDITYILTEEGWLYLSSVLDLGSRRFVGYAMAEHMRTDLITDALTMAVGLRGGQVERTIFHSDRGNQYCPPTTR